MENILFNPEKYNSEDLVNETIKINEVYFWT